MNNLKVMFDKLYESGFVMGNSEDAKKAVRMVQRLLKQNALDESLMLIADENEKIREIMNKSLYDLDIMEDFSVMKDFMKVAHETEKLETKALDPGTVYYYTEMGRSMGILEDDEGIQDEIEIEPLLSEFDSEGKLIEEPESVVKKENEEEDIVIEPLLSDVPMPEVKVPDDIRNKRVSDVMKIITRPNADESDELSAGDLEKNLVSNQIKNHTKNAFLSNYLSHQEKPLSAMIALVPSGGDDKQTEEIRSSGGTFFYRVLSRVGLKDLSDEVKNATDGHADLKSIFRFAESRIEALPNKADIYKKLVDGFYLSTVLDRMYLRFDDEKMNKQLTDFFLRDPDSMNCIPVSAQKSILEHPEIGDYHPYEKEIDSYLKTVPENDPLHAALEDANEILTRGRAGYVDETSLIAESVGKIGDRSIARNTFEYMKKTIPDFKGKLSYANIEFPDEKDGFRDFLKNEIDNGPSMDEDFREDLKKIVSSMQESGMFDPLTYVPEEGQPKVYVMHALNNAKRNVELAVSEHDAEQIKVTTEKYRELEAKYDAIMQHLEEIAPENGSITANVSVSRNGYMPSKYRSDYRGVTMMSSLYHTMGFCSLSGIDINDYIDNPVESIRKGISRMYEDTLVPRIFSDKTKSRMDIINDLTNRTKEITESTNRLLSKSGCVSRGAMGIVNLYNGKNREEINASVCAAEPFNTQLVNAVMQMSNFFGANKDKTIANILMYKDEDLDPIKVNADIKDVINPTTMEVKKPMSLKEYIRANYTFDELAEKFASIHQIVEEKGIDAIGDKVMDEISEAIQYSDKFSLLETSCLRNVLRTGHDPYVEARNAHDDVVVADSDADKNLVEFYENFNALVAESLGIPQTDDVLEGQKRIMDSYYNPLRIDFYMKKLGEEFTKKGIDIKALGFTEDTGGIMSALREAVLGGNAAFKGFSLPENYFDVLKEESYKQFDEPISIPADLYARNPQFAEDIKKTFIGVTTDTADALSRLENDPMDKSAYATERAIANEISKEHPELASSFTKGTNVSNIDPYKNKEYSKSLVERYDDFHFSPETKNAILTVYNTMKDYGMMIHFPEKGEEGVKMYGLHKYAEAMGELKDAISKGDINRAHEISESYQGLMTEYRDVFDKCEALFPQDGLHCAGNLSASRHSYVPREFTERQQALMQMSSVYMIGALVDKYDLKIEDVLEHPGDALRTIARFQKDAIEGHLKDKDGEVSFAQAMNEDLSGLDMLTMRGLEALTVLESDESIRKQNALINMEFYGVSNTTSRLYAPFAKYEDNDPNKKFLGADYDSMKQFIAASGTSVDLTNFLANQINPETGTTFENHFDYPKFLKENTSTPSEILEDVLSRLSKGLIDIQNMEENEEKYGSFLPSKNMTFNHMYVASAMFLSDYIREKGLEDDLSFGVTAMRAFINNPADALRSYVNLNYPDKAEDLDYRDEDVNKLLSDNHVEASRTKKTASTYYEHLKSESLENLLSEYNEMNGDSEIAIGPDNLATYMLIAKRCKDMYDEHGILGKIFSSDAHKESNVEAAIHKACIKAGVKEADYNDIVNGKVDDLNAEMSMIEDSFKMNQALESLKPENVKNTLMTIFNKHGEEELSGIERDLLSKKGPLTAEERVEKMNAEKILQGDDLNYNNFRKIVSLYDDVAGLSTFKSLDAATRGYIKESLKLVKDEMAHRNIYEDHIIGFKSGSMSEDEIIKLSREEAQSEVTRVIVDLDNESIYKEDEVDLNKSFISENSIDLEEFDDENELERQNAIVEEDFENTR